MTTTVAQRKRTKGWRKPDGAVCVTRPGEWGNPWPVGDWVSLPIDGGSDWVGVEIDQHLAVELFRAWLADSEDEAAVRMRDRLGELRGKTLLCWCDPAGPCHAYVLAEMADAA